MKIYTRGLELYYAAPQVLRLCKDKPVLSVPTSQRIHTSISTTNDDTKAMVTMMNYFYFKFYF